MNYLGIETMNTKTRKKDILLIKPRLDKQFQCWIDNLKKYAKGKVNIDHVATEDHAREFVEKQKRHYSSKNNTTLRNYEQKNILRGWAWNHRNQKVGKIFYLKRRDIDTLTNKSWLNDEVINFFMNIMKTEYYVMGVNHIQTLWYQKYVDEGYKGVKTWYDYGSFLFNWMIFIPIN